MSVFTFDEIKKMNKNISKFKIECILEGKTGKRSTTASRECLDDKIRKFYAEEVRKRFEELARSNDVKPSEKSAYVKVDTTVDK